jgi:excisionase family DNA binding protein
MKRSTSRIEKARAQLADVANKIAAISEAVGDDNEQLAAAIRDLADAVRSQAAANLSLADAIGRTTPLPSADQPQRGQYCTVREARASLCCGSTKLYDLIGSNKIRAVKDGGRTLIDIRSIDAYLASLPVGINSTGHRAMRGI